MFCNYCKSQIPDQSKFCPNCGAMMAPVNTPPVSHMRQPQQPYPQQVYPPQYANQRPRKKKSGGLIISLILALSVVFVLFLQNNSKENAPAENITTVLDCSKFSQISVDDLRKELGEPKSIEDWNNQTNKGNFQMQIYSYDFSDFYGEFITYENTVVKVRLFSNSQWKIEGSNFNNIFAMFGIIPDKSLKKTIDNGITYKFSPVSDKIAKVEIYNFDKKNKTFTMIYVTYNLNYFFD